MSRRSFLLIIILVFMGLACNVPSVAPSPHSGMESVDVSPSSGSGTFKVTVYYFWSKADENFTISCSYPSDTGYPITAPIPLTHEDRASEFTISVPIPGHHTINCTDSTGDSRSVVFTVFGQPTATKLSAFELPKLGQFSSAGMWFYFDTATTTVDKFFLQHCLPGANYNDQGGSDYFRVAPDGTLTGDCQYAYGKSLILTGKITEGKWTEDGKVTFRLESQAVSNSTSSFNPGTATYEMVWLGTGQFTSATSATGTATWTGVCKTINPNAAPCVKAEFGPYLEAKGTIQWIINFVP